MYKKSDITSVNCHDILISKSRKHGHDRTILGSGVRLFLKAISRKVLSSTPGCNGRSILQE